MARVKGVQRDYVLAHMWFSLAAAHGHSGAANSRQIVATRMTPAQIAQAKGLIAAWKPTTAQ